MSDLDRIRLRTLGWSVLPITVMVLVPWLLSRLAHETVAWHGSPGQWLGAWLLLNGLGVMGWCVNLFNVEGQGTPLPLDPPRRFVAGGPYRYVRNPMMWGLFLTLGGEALLCRSAILWWYLVLIIVLASLFVRLYEEPELTQRFGPTYGEYRRQVPRWIPRLPRQSRRRES
ncbi:MAG: isoprenylcysteine carboxylmethyltransferase family protein [Candidatus Omnitrophica bacterium]|nr:isoprenylcysteine carboxylmethyltransferase family protein [Candidatus Omnitrophota bacterium]